MNDNRKKTVGKFLSLVLRHNPDKIKITLDENGWADVSELISKCGKARVSFSMGDLIEIVDTNDKKRYSFNSDKTKIRANQGHSIDVDLELKAVEPPEFLYHGTALRFKSLILDEGVKKMNRQHVHLSKDKSTALKVGSRHGNPHIFTILSGKMYSEGILFYCSDNGVWLTDFIDPKYISE